MVFSPLPICFLEKVTTKGMFAVAQDAIIASAFDVISTDSLSTVAFINDRLDPGVLTALGNEFGNEVVSEYMRPPSQTSLAKELVRMEDSLEDISDDWFEVDIKTPIRRIII